MEIKQTINNRLNHLYISPLEKCNLNCKICYTKKTKYILAEKDILNFIERYKKAHKLKTITFCGGEVFTLPYFTELVNKLTASGIFVQNITNGTIDILNKLQHPNSINLIVSIDGLKEYHDKNREQGNFEKSVNFLKKAHKFGFHTEIFSIVTKQNYPKIDYFEEKIQKILGYNLPITYHPRKPKEYLKNHPISNITGQIDGFDFLEKDKIVNLMRTKKTFPPISLDCYQISLMSSGEVFGCCEGTVPIGKINDDIMVLFKNLENKLRQCKNCCEPDFICGLKVGVCKCKPQGVYIYKPLQK